ncbi:hypothetical protein LVR06_25325, partial [Klebsiella pneumoniae]|nr:hypothetical protein [Klebsiella pneumoniae]
GMVCVVGRMRDLILQLSKSSIYSTKPVHACHISYLLPGSVRIQHLSFLRNDTGVHSFYCYSMT